MRLWNSSLKKKASTTVWLVTIIAIIPIWESLQGVPTPASFGKKNTCRTQQQGLTLCPPASIGLLRMRTSMFVNFAIHDLFANWSLSAQTLCPYETVAFGYSSFCDLFTYQEWQGFEYSIDLSFAGNNYFESPTGRAVGIGYVEEVLARLTNHTITSATAQDNITLDNNTVTFPLNQTLYFDFSHDTNIAAILTAFGLTQFAPILPTSGPPPDQQLIVSHLQPFGARVDIEIINAPQPVAANRTEVANTSYTAGPPTSYVHFIINQRTLPLGDSFPSCGNRTDGWCELLTFIKIQQQSLANATYDYSCNGDYPAVPYGSLTNGVPQATAT